MTRAAMFGLLVTGIALGMPLDAASQRTPSITVVLPDTRALFGRHRMPAPSTSVPPRATQTSRGLVVYVPFLVAHRTQQCAEVHVLTRLAFMTDVDGSLHSDLATGESLMCDGFMHRLDRWPNGKRAMSLLGTWTYPNGNRGNAANGTWYYPDGTRARTPVGAWYYPSGKLARTNTGTWFTPARERIGRIDHPNDIMVFISILERLWFASGAAS
jgi:hypothetical protein